MSDWGHESEDLFRAARQGLSPKANDRERVRARIRAKVAAAAVGVAVAGTAAKTAGAGTGAAVGAGAGASASAGAGASAAVAAKGLTLGLVAKIAVPLVIAGAGIAAAPHVLHTQAFAPTPAAVIAPPAAPPVAAAAKAAIVAPVVVPPEPIPATTVDALPAALPAAAPHETPRALPRVPGRPRAEATPPPAPPVVAAAEPASAVSHDEEAALVGQIDAALRAGDPSSALRLASDHQRRFPRGVLAEEREGARVVAQCMSGSRSPGGASFLAAHPRSPMRARIVAACETNDDRTKPVR